MSLRKKNNRLEPEGNNPERYGKALAAIKDDDLVNKKQFDDGLGVVIVSQGAFTTLDPDRALKVRRNGVDYYLPIYIFP